VTDGFSAASDAHPSCPAESPLDAFVGNPVLPRATPLYRAALAAVAAVMVMLPVVYLGILGVVAWAVWWHAWHDTWIIHGWVGALLYIGPIVAGIVLAFFMSKPFFAGTPPGPPRFTVDDRTEPLLTAFIARLCSELHAPRPIRIDLNDQANASASFERGVRGFLAGRVVLTIGLPLVAGMTMQQFAGVLAHEFGHFAQGAGMRLSQTIRGINLWFARIVYQRDEWDARLEAWSKDLDVRIGAILMLARVAVGATRLVLKVLMYAGHAVSCLLMRQMEFDADRHQCAVAGSDSFEPTVRRVHELSFARRVVDSDLQRGWLDKQLPDDLPMLVAQRLQGAGLETRRAVDETVSAGVTGVFDTHPAPSDRIRAARTTRAPGIFHLLQPASWLFSSFDQRCHDFSRFYYVQVLQLPLEAAQMVPLAAYLRPLVAQDARRQALQRFFGAAGPVSLSPLSPPPGTGTVVQIDQVLDAAAKARARMEELQESAARASERCATLESERWRLLVAVVLAESGVPVAAKDVGVLEIDLAGTADVVDAIKRARSRVEGELTLAARGLDPFRLAATERLSAELRLLADVSVASALGDPPAVVDEASRLVGIVNAVNAEKDAVHTIHVTLQAIAALSGLACGSDAASQETGARVQLATLSLGNSLRPHASRLLARLRALTLPGRDGHPTLADALIAESGWHETPGPVDDLLNLFGRLSELQLQAMSRLAEIVEAAVAGVSSKGTEATCPPSPLHGY